MTPDVLMRVRLKTTAEGGRQSDVMGPVYGCPLLVGAHAFDCRLLPFEKLTLGKEEIVEAKLLDRQPALLHLRVGQRVDLWEGRVIGSAMILEIFEAR